MLIEMMEPDVKFSNETGLLVQLVHEGWNQVNVLVSNAGATRGGHYHKVSKEVFYIVSGSIKLLIETENEKEEYILNQNDMFMVLPYQKHTFTFIEDTVMVSMYDVCVEKEDGTKDIYK